MAVAETGVMTFLIAQISDLHVRRRGDLMGGRVDTCAALERAVAAIGRLDPRPDVVLLTGDLVDSGDDEAEYVQLRDILRALPMPWYAIPGNHDGRRAMRSVFRDRGELQRDADFIQYAIDDWPVRLVCLDTLDPGSGAGLLDDARLAWLESELARPPRRPTLLAMHHPPFETGIRFMDSISCRGAAALARLLERGGGVDLLVCGHLHRAVIARFAGAVACAAPSTAHQVRLDLRPFDTSPGDYVLEPPGYLLHRWTQEAGFATHVATVGDWPGPFPFDD